MLTRSCLLALLVGLVAACSSSNPRAPTPAPGAPTQAPAPTPAPTTPTPTWQAPSAPPVSSDPGIRTLPGDPVGALAAETRPPPPPGTASSTVEPALPPPAARTPSGSGGTGAGRAPDDLGVAPTGTLPPPRVVPGSGR